MSGLAFDPPAWPALVAGAAALVAWLAIARPTSRAPVRAAFRVSAGLLLALALLDAGCRGAVGGERPRLHVLVDVSRSMEVADAGGTPRSERVRAFLESAAFRAWSGGWEVVVDSFGGATTDPGGTLGAAAAGAPGAILIVSDGRATTGLAPAPPGMDLWAYAPGPLALEDAAVLDVEIERPGDGPDYAVAEVAAVGGEAVGEGLALVVSVDGREAGREPLGALPAGERRRVRVALPRREPGAVVEARIEPGRDPVPANDRRSAVDAGGEEARRALVVGLAPGWEMGAWRRAVVDAWPGPVDAAWVDPTGALRPVDGGAARSWGAYDPARYRSAHLIGDPARLGSAGRAWLGRFAAAGGRGIVWMPGGAGGGIAGVRIAPGGRVGTPATTAAGREWLEARGVVAGGPDGGPAWPALERLPVGPEPPPGATVLFEAAGAPAAWVEEREDARVAALLGTGWYRWPIETGGPTGPAPAFWEAWTDALVRWLAAAPSAERPLIAWPEGRRAPAGRAIEAVVAGGVESAVAWRVEDAAGEAVATGEVTAPAGGGRIAVGPLEPGVYRLEAEAAGPRAGGGRFVVEAFAPDLARTEADTAALAAAARPGAGGLLDGPPSGRLRAPDDTGPAPTASAGPVAGLGTRPWAYLAAALLLLADWALGARALARPERAR